MAKRRGNKAAMIREEFAALGANARPKDVIAALAAKKITVSSAQVSNVKSTMGIRKRANGPLTIDTLLEAKKLVDKLGMGRAQAAMHALKQLQ